MHALGEALHRHHGDRGFHIWGEALPGTRGKVIYNGKDLGWDNVISSAVNFWARVKSSEIRNLGVLFKWVPSQGDVQLSICHVWLRFIWGV